MARRALGRLSEREKNALAIVKGELPEAAGTTCGWNESFCGHISIGQGAAPHQQADNTIHEPILC